LAEKARAANKNNALRRFSKGPEIICLPLADFLAESKKQYIKFFFLGASISNKEKEYKKKLIFFHSFEKTRQPAVLFVFLRVLVDNFSALKIEPI